MKTDNVKEKILSVTMELLHECEAVEKVTMREIAVRAGVGVGLINYHFQTKENLIALSVQRIIDGVILRFERTAQSLNLEPLEKLRFLAKRNCTFLVHYRSICRISILSDFENGSFTDNTSRSVRAYCPIVNAATGGRRSYQEVYLETSIMVSAFQSAFLRREVFAAGLQLDFYDPWQRDIIVDMIIDSIINPNPN